MLVIWFVSLRFSLICSVIWCISVYNHYPLRFDWIIKKQNNTKLWHFWSFYILSTWIQYFLSINVAFFFAGKRIVWKEEKEYENNCFCLEEHALDALYQKVKRVDFATIWIKAPVNILSCFSFLKDERCRFLMKSLSVS